MIILDYETRSECDLKACGLYVYATDLSTEILCLAMYDTDTDEQVLFYPIEGQTMPEKWKGKLRRAELVGAMNAAFDREIHACIGVLDHGYPKIPDHKWYCIAAQCRLNGLPSNLDDATKAAKVKHKKNPDGVGLIKKMCIPPFEYNMTLLNKMGQYCLDDVLAAVELFRNTRPMTKIEHKDWLITEKMNIRGVKIDRELAQLATKYAGAEQADISEKLDKLTDGVITKPTQYQRIKQYIEEALDLDDENDRKLLKLMTVYKKDEKKLGLDKDIRESIITVIDAGNLHLYEDIEELIRLLHDASASSVSKFAKMNTLADPEDDRVRGAFIHAGAAQTHRYSSKGLQMHNMRRDCFNAEIAEELKDYMKQGVEIPNVMQTLAKLLRPALVPDEGNQFVVGDWSAIEARALPWLSGDPRAERKLDMFRNGIDVYVEAAKNLGGERQIGKVAELALGYGGAVGAFASMAKNYGVVLPDYAVKKIVRQWRADNPWAETFWHALESAAKKAVRARGTKSFKAGRVEYTFAPNLLGGTLICMLPDGTGIQYPFCSIEHTDKGDNLVCLKAGIKPKKGEKSKHHWGTVRLWGGLLSENVTQAFCAALLRDKLRECDVLNIPVILHVHDEIGVECESSVTRNYRKALKEVMEQIPEYAEGLPLDAEPVVLDRYGNH